MVGSLVLGQITDQGIRLYEQGQVLDPQPETSVQPKHHPQQARQWNSKKRTMSMLINEAAEDTHPNHVTLKSEVFVEGKETKEVDAVLFSVPVPIKAATAETEARDNEL